MISTHIENRYKTTLGQSIKNPHQTLLRPIINTLRKLGHQLHASMPSTPSLPSWSTLKHCVIPQCNVGAPKKKPAPTPQAQPKMSSEIKHKLLREAERKQEHIWGAEVIQLAKLLGTADYGSVKALSTPLEDIELLHRILEGSVSIDDIVLTRNMNPDPRYLIEKQDGSYEIKNCLTAKARVLDYSDLEVIRNQHGKPTFIGRRKRAGMNSDLHQPLAQKGVAQASIHIQAEKPNKHQMPYLPKGGINFLIMHKKHGPQKNLYAGKLTVTCKLSDVFAIGAKIHDDISSSHCNAILVDASNGAALPVIDIKQNVGS